MGIASQKLMSFLLATTALSDIVHAVTATFADLLLSGETEGFAIDATGVTASPAYVGAPEAGYISIKEYDSPAALMSNLPLDDPRSPLVQSGTSPKLVRYHSDNGDSPGSDYPLMRWTPHNLVPQSQTFDTTWALASTGNVSVSSNSTTAPDGTSTADTLTATDTSNCGIQYSNPITFLAGVAYTLSIYVKDNGTNDHILLQASDRTANAAGYYFNISAGTVGTSSPAGTGSNVVPGTITSVGSGWYRCQITVSFSADNSAVDFALYVTNADNSLNCDSGQGTYIWGAQLVRGYNANPYLVTTSAARIGIPVEYDTAAAQYGILVEPAATNLCLQSEAFGTTWTVNGSATITSNSTTSPDGATTADTLNANAVGQHYVYQASITVTQSVAYTSSIFAKKAAGNGWLELLVFDGTDSVRAWFNLNTGVVGSTTAQVSGTAGAISITSIGNGWYRCSFVSTLTSSTSVTLFVIPTDGDASHASAGATDQIYLWGAQHELGTVATSYIPTLGATVTRAVDSISAPTTAFPVGNTHTLYVNGKLLSVASAATFATLYASTGSGYSDSLYANSMTDIHVYADNNGVGQADFSQAAISSGAAFKTAARYGTNDYHGAMNGTLAASPDTSGTYTNNRIGLYFYVTGQPTHARLYQVMSLPRAMTNGQLQTVTT